MTSHCQRSVPISAIEHEISSGGLSEEELQKVTTALYARGVQNFTFLDFLDYVPFFNTLHAKIINSTLRDTLTEEEETVERYQNARKKQEYLHLRGTYESVEMYRLRIDELTAAEINEQQQRELLIKAQMGDLDLGD